VRSLQQSLLDDDPTRVARPVTEELVSQRSANFWRVLL
jgi:hypothetical protein